MSKKEVLPYNPHWPKDFLKIQTHLKDVLGPVALQIHHIGSTSVPGLAAKRDIDVLCVVTQLDQSRSLERNGYIFKGEMNVPLRYFFSSVDESIKVNLHVVEEGHGFIELNLAFRNFLRENAEARVAYERLKYSLLTDPKSQERQSGRFTGYTLGKDDFIKSILRSADFKGQSTNFCIHEREWAAFYAFFPDAEGGISFVLYEGVDIVAAAHVKANKEISLKGVDKSFKLALGETVKKWMNHEKNLKNAS